MAIVAVLYNFGFFTLLAYTPFPLGLGIHQLGFVFFGWGLLLALTSVFAAQPLERRFGLVPTLAVALAAVAADLLIGGLFLHDQTVLIVVVIVSGAFLGIVNTVLTEAVMAAASVERPIASSAYSFVRFTGGAIAPFLAGKMAEHISSETPMLVGAAMVFAAVAVLLVKRGVLAERAARRTAPRLRAGRSPSTRPRRKRSGAARRLLRRTRWCGRWQRRRDDRRRRCRSRRRDDRRLWPGGRDRSSVRLARTDAVGPASVTPEPRDDHRRGQGGTDPPGRRTDEALRCRHGPGRTRTCDPLLRRQPLCPAELRGPLREA